MAVSLGLLRVAGDGRKKIEAERNALRFELSCCECDVCRESKPDVKDIGGIEACPACHDMLVQITTIYYGSLFGGQYRPPFPVRYNNLVQRGYATLDNGILHLTETGRALVPTRPARSDIVCLLPHVEPDETDRLANDVRAMQYPV